MKKLHSTLLVGIMAIAAWAMTGCTGYPDGPGVSFKSAQSKITTTWRIQDASLKGNEITSEYTDDFLQFNSNGEFQYFDANRQIRIPPFTQDTIMPIEGLGQWEFLDGNKQVELFYTFEFVDPYNSDIIYSEDINERWDITRLADGELWMRKGDLFLKLEFF
ncbi:MAG: hypothetical protein KDD63_18895 [Bacteroidetes bacterium]|nr:hypothetical protein [Bacteroidota bacterium]MCB0846079.1 hypothetical protein [Bacteroidota bacterium]MCB0854301.1 hypothetical protein [Bacteroidota bacterium]